MVSARCSARHDAPVRMQARSIHLRGFASHIHTWYRSAYLGVWQVAGTARLVCFYMVVSSACVLFFPPFFESGTPHADVFL